MLITFVWANTLSQAVPAVTTWVVPRVGDLILVGGRKHPVKDVIWSFEKDPPSVEVRLDIKAEYV